MRQSEVLEGVGFEKDGGDGLHEPQAREEVAWECREFLRGAGFKCRRVCIRTPPKRVADKFSLAPNLGAPVSRRQLDDHKHSCALRVQ